VEKYFKNKKNGHISIVSSVAAYRGLPNSSGYGPSKAALTNLTESLYFDFKKYNVRISLVSPGFIKTPLTDKNEFPMPFIKSPEFAADKMFNGLTKSNSFEIHFPKTLTILLKIFRVLPYKIYLYLIDKVVKR
jgi:short-subunit dehydrogenase